MRGDEEQKSTIAILAPRGGSKSGASEAVAGHQWLLENEGGPRLPRRDRRRGKVVSSAWAREGAGDRRLRKAAYEAMGNGLGAAYCGRSMGNVLRRMNDYAGATDKFHEAMVMFDIAGDQCGSAWCLRYLALIFIDQGQNDEVETLVERASQIFIEISMPDQADSCRALLNEAHAADESPKTEAVGSNVASSVTFAEAAREGAEWRAC
ncbi:hypothetical protein CALCODRAFT_152994 [Calocera cornea HHB12733]|uniref:TPR-like protein n=1 Tax=Calocera cornea HHB12733 TaxID=1353952 RepID=A0A165CMW8_9BASI|nr:hypothetical protein CALCODRAFT_152994 [Calocera cornea HHB12733]